MKIRTLIFSLFLTVCFFGTALADNKPRVPEKYQKGFLTRYEVLLDKDTRKAFDKLSTDQERDDFISNFWKERDTDPNTPENEFKNEIDQRITNIQNEIFLGDSDLAGFRFADNGGLKGDIARVYILHGPPDFKYKNFNGHNFVDLMLWLYVDETGQNPKYMFLFYQKFGVGSMSVFRLQSPQLEWGLKEISRFGENGIADTYSELESIVPEGQLIMLALMEFSYDSQIRVDEALDPPKPAALLAQKLGSKIVGQPDISKKLEVIYSSEHSFIPANFQVITTSTLEFPESKSIALSLGIRYGDIDWIVVEERELRNAKDSSRGDKDQLKAVLRLKLIFENKQSKESSFYNWDISLKIPKSKLIEDPKSYMNIPLTELNEIISKKLSPGIYRFNVYLKHTLTNKYNSWLEEVTK